MQSNAIGPRRTLVPHREISKDSNIKPHLTFDAKNSKEDVPQGHRLRFSVSHSKNMVTVTGENQEDGSMSPPSEWGSTVNTLEKDLRDQPGDSAGSANNDIVAVETGNVLAEVQKKVHFATDNDATSHGNFVFQIPVSK